MKARAGLDSLKMLMGGLSKKETSEMTDKILADAKAKGQDYFGAPNSNGEANSFQPVFGLNQVPQYNFEPGAGQALPEFADAFTGWGKKFNKRVDAANQAQFQVAANKFAQDYFNQNPIVNQAYFNNQGINSQQASQPRLNPQLLGQMGVGASSAPQNSMLSNLATRGMQQMSAGQTMNPTLGKATS
jgi:hypothetical protein